MSVEIILDSEKILDSIKGSDDKAAFLAYENEKNFYRDKAEELRIERIEEELNRFRSENKNRTYFAYILLAVTILWMIAILDIIYLVGFQKMILSDTILVTLITTTTANVFGFLFLVVKYLFNEKKST